MPDVQEPIIVRGGWPRLDVQRYVVAIIVPTLALVVVVVVAVLLRGLYDPRVDNDKVFAIIGPAFQTIIGGFMGFLGGLAITRGTRSRDTGD